MPDTDSNLAFELPEKVIFGFQAENQARVWLAEAQRSYDELTDRYGPRRPAEVSRDRLCELAIGIAQAYAMLGASMAVRENANS